MRRAALIAVVLLCVCACTAAQGSGLPVMGSTWKGTSGGATWSAVARTQDRATWVVKYTCASNVCTLVVPSTSTGHALMLFAFDTGGLAAPTVAGGCGSWTNQASAHVTSGPVGGLSASTCAASTSGTTSITVTYGSAPGDPSVVYFDGTCGGGGTVSFDVAGNRSAGSLETNPVGVTLSLTGTNDLIAQVSASGTSGDLTAASSPYNTPAFSAVTTTGGNSMAFVASSFVSNSTNTTVTWTGTNDFYLNTAMAMKCQ